MNRLVVKTDNSQFRVGWFNPGCYIECKLNIKKLSKMANQKNLF